jgi:hypothetical protein
MKTDLSRSTRENSERREATETRKNDARPRFSLTAALA